MSASGDTEEKVLVLLPKSTVRVLLALASVGRSLIALARVSRPLQRLAAVARPLEAFIRNPTQFIFGVIIVGVLAVLEQATISLLDAIIRLLGGTQPFSSPRTEAQPGLADIPIIIVRPLLDAGGVVGGRFVDTIAFLQDLIFEASLIAGPLAPLVHITLWGVLTVLALAAMYRLLLALLTLLPGGKSLLVILTGNQ